MRRRFSRLVAAACLALVAVLGATAAPGHADECGPDCLIISLHSGPVTWEHPRDTPNVIVVGLSERMAEPVTFWFQTSDGTATAPADYLAIDRLVRVPAGELEVAVPVDIVPDRITEPDEFFYATISDPSAGQIGVGQTEVTIRDGAPPRRG